MSMKVFGVAVLGMGLTLASSACTRRSCNNARQNQSVVAEGDSCDGADCGQTTGKATGALEQYAQKYFTPADKKGFEQLKFVSADMMRSNPDFVVLHFFITNGSFNGKTPSEIYAQENTWAEMMNDLCTEYFSKHVSGYRKSANLAATADRAASLMAHELKPLSEGNNAEMNHWGYVMRCTNMYKIIARSIDRQQHASAAAKPLFSAEACQWSGLYDAFQTFAKYAVDMKFDGASMIPAMFSGACLDVVEARIALLDKKDKPTGSTAQAVAKFNSSVDACVKKLSGSIDGSNEDKHLIEHKKELEKHAAELKRQMTAWTSSVNGLRSADSNLNASASAFIGIMSDAVKRCAE